MSKQHSLFEPMPVSLLNDGEGGIRYLPGIVPMATAEQWFEQTLQSIDWISQQRVMYDREVAVPRLLATFSDDSCNLPAPLTAAFDAVRSLVRAPFNRVGLNLYRDGHDSVAPHSDKTEKLLRAQPIAILSLGATRRMLIHPKKGDGRVVHIDLEPGSCLVMSYASQFTHEHGIPKVANVNDARISLAFRCFAG
jgi:alkylated DNA repair dioxygenase AlkB